jgi:hypothetical protein
MLRWWFEGSSTPGGVGRHAAAQALQRAAANVVTGRNSCGLPDQIDATERYMGHTTAAPDVTDSSTCGRPDGRSVVGFGTLAPVEMAITCWWTRDGSIVEADVKLNKTDYRWVTRIPSSCALSWSIEDVATHEFGHVFGLEHVTRACTATSR